MYGLIMEDNDLVYYMNDIFPLTPLAEIMREQHTKKIYVACCRFDILYWVV